MDIANFISNVGFPIACCIYMGFYLQKTNESHKEEMTVMSKAIENNTEAIRELREELRNGVRKNEHSD